MSLTPQVWSTYKKHRETIKSQVVEQLAAGKTPVLTFSKIMDLARFVKTNGLGELVLAATFTESQAAKDFETAANAPKPVKTKVVKDKPPVEAKPEVAAAPSAANATAPIAAASVAGEEDWNG